MSEQLYTAADLAHWYCLGVQHERERAAAAQTELDASWTRSGAQVSRDRHRHLMRLFRRKAEDVAESMGRRYVPYTGGPVIWP